MGMETAAILEEAIEEMRKLISEYDSEREYLKLALDGEILSAYEELISKTEETSKTIQNQMMSIEDQALLL